jgi:hypothetical protein
VGFCYLNVDLRFDGMSCSIDLSVSDFPLPLCPTNAVELVIVKFISTKILSLLVIYSFLV